MNERPDDAELAGSGACELALTVEERGAGQFYWVVLQAANDESQDVMVYRRVEMAARALQSYSTALIVGAAVVRPGV
ncbi:MAG: hypothetical protein EOO24_44350 [Comamonadaceae bacterium]|nr:MAG: hypothetical protein EOO24_44350 [Comamonadaceae bacterium]